MEKKPRLLLKLKKEKSPLDPCPVCRKELYYDDKYTQRVALLGKEECIEGWMCPFCKSKFDYDNKLTYISMPGNTTGKA
jgi:uncharacterized protein YbaR (Trm112 family)